MATSENQTELFPSPTRDWPFLHSYPLVWLGPTITRTTPAGDIRWQVQIHKAGFDDPKWGRPTTWEVALYKWDGTRRDPQIATPYRFRSAYREVGDRDQADALAFRWTEAITRHQERRDAANAST